MATIVMLKRAAGDAGPAAKPKVDLGGSSGHDDPRLSARMQELMKDMGFFLELGRFDEATKRPGVLGIVNGSASTSMLLTTKQIAEGTPQVFEMTSSKLRHLTSEEIGLAKEAEAGVFESEFYGLHYKGPIPGHMEMRRRS